MCVSHQRVPATASPTPQEAVAGPPAPVASSGMDLAAPIVAATVHPDRARITRRGAVSLDAGATELVVPGLPDTLLDESVRVAGRSGAPVRVIGVDMVRRDLATTPDDRVRAAEQTLRTPSGPSPRSKGPTRATPRGSSCCSASRCVRATGWPSRWPRAPRVRRGSARCPPRSPRSSSRSRRAARAHRAAGRRRTGTGRSAGRAGPPAQLRAPPPRRPDRGGGRRARRAGAGADLRRPRRGLDLRLRRPRRRRRTARPHLVRHGHAVDGGGLARVRAHALDGPARASRAPCRNSPPGGSTCGPRRNP